MKVFNQDSNLIKHNKIHEKIILKQFKCSYENCQRQYTSKSSLNRHFIIHSQVTPSTALEEPKVIHSNSLTYRALDFPYSSVNVSRCLYSDCNFRFTVINDDLSVHLFKHAPGLLQEFKQMREMMLNLIHILETHWNIVAYRKQVRI